MDALGFLNAFADFIVPSPGLYRYAGYTGGWGALLVKIRSSGNTVVIRPWERTLPIGRADLVRSDLRYEVFRGHEPELQVHVGKHFRPNAIRYARSGDRSALIAVEAQQVSIIQSGNIPKPLLDALLSFCAKAGLGALYDFTGTLVHEGFDGAVPQAGRLAGRRNLRVFLSYTWETDSHRRWVLKLAADLMRNGVHVLIDEWDLRDFHDDLHFFMETGIRESDFVVLVCTPEYARRANARRGGVGVESSIITGEFYEPATATKFLPIVRKGTQDVERSLPSYLKTRYAIDFTNDASYDRSLEDLLRRMYGRPRYRRPRLGPVPEFTSESI
ncbi:MAG: toll/interleukin-1 receptor domain-containing protein [Chloroflexota bacterium]|nr:toll/interleukin-1 receptor domain-containing protein [Chloroflexota bacterium]